MAWSLAQLLQGLHTEVERRLSVVRQSLDHKTSKGDASEGVWIDLLNKYLPNRYCATRATVVDSRGAFSESIDVVVYDRQYSPLIFEVEGQRVIAAESVYAVFEAKQTIGAGNVRYAQAKARSVRELHRTSLPIPYAKGVYPPKALHSILAGLLTLESRWTPPLGASLKKAWRTGEENEHLDIGCVAAHGYFFADGGSTELEIHSDGKHATAFLFKLIELLQAQATVPMIDIQAYAKWLAE